MTPYDTSKDAPGPKKPPQHKSVREVAAEVVAPVEARMAGMEDWLAGYTKTTQERLKNIEALLGSLEGIVSWLSLPWYTRAWMWVRAKTRR